MLQKMQIEIWSDIMCPFCYIGKKQFDAALEQFDFRDEVNITWKSFELIPNLQTNTDITIQEFLIQHKGMSPEHTQLFVERIVTTASEVGLKFDFNAIVVANTIKCHQLLHFAHQKGFQDELKERLLKAYFIEGINVDNIPHLIQLGSEVGLDIDELRDVLDSSSFLTEIKQDISEAKNLGINGIPYFVFDRKYGASGAQGANKFSEILQQSHNEWKQSLAPQKLTVIDGENCDINGHCD